MTNLTERATLITAIREARELGYIVCVKLNAKTTVLQAAYDDLMESLDFCEFATEGEPVTEEEDEDEDEGFFDNHEEVYYDHEEAYQDNHDEAFYDDHDEALRPERLVYLEMMVTLYSFVIGLLTLVELVHTTLTRLTPQAVSQLQEVYNVLKRLQPQPVNS